MLYHYLYNVSIRMRHSRLECNRQVPSDWYHIVVPGDRLQLSTTRTSARSPRHDGAFYAQEIVHPLGAVRLGYAIVARMTQPLRQRMVAARYHEFVRGW